MILFNSVMISLISSLVSQNHVSDPYLRVILESGIRARPPVNASPDQLEVTGQ